MTDNKYPGEDPELVAFLEMYKGKMFALLAEHLNNGKPFTEKQQETIWTRLLAAVEADPNIDRSYAWTHIADEVARQIPYNSPEIDRIMAEIKAKKTES